MKHGEKLHVPMAMMDSTNPVDALRKCLTDAQLVYQADQCAETLNDMQAAQRALDDAMPMPTVNDKGRSADYVESERDAMIHDLRDAWRG